VKEKKGEKEKGRKKKKQCDLKTERKRKKGTNFPKPIGQRITNKESKQKTNVINAIGSQRGKNKHVRDNHNNNE